MPVPWSTGHGFYFPERPVFTADPLFHAGGYYVQEASSMFLGYLFGRICPQAGLRTLDLCAAPGGKTTHLASLLTDGGVVVANEVVRNRAVTLTENVQKWGTGNVVVTSNDPADFGTRLPGFFDVMVVDAPCSGEGMFRKDPAARGEWSSEHVKLCAARQKRILSDVWDSLRPGGVLFYSTCTFNRQENEQNVEWIVRELGAEAITDGLADGDLPDAGIDVSTPGCYRFMPHRTRGEGFFIAALRKRGQASAPAAAKLKKPGILNFLGGAQRKELAAWLRPGLETYVLWGDQVYGYTPQMRQAVEAMAGKFQMLYSGTGVGEMIRGKLEKPAQSLAQSLFLDTSSRMFRVSELDLEQALVYLRKGTFSPDAVSELFTQGLNLVTFQGLPLGWLKRIGNRCNNLYPAARRILHY